jgi:hypothetical protein
MPSNTTHESAVGVESPKAAPSERPVRNARHTAHASQSNQWPGVWFALAEHQWSSLVVIPAHAETSASSTVRAIVAAARLYDERTINVLDADDIAASAVRDIVAHMAERARAGELSIVSLPSPLRNHSAIPIARAADAAVLLVPLGKAEFADSRRAIEMVGRSHFIGGINMSRV